MQLAEITSYLDDYLKIADYKDRCNNGLQVQGNPEVTKVAFAVDASLAAFKGALNYGAQLLFVHHGLFWSNHVQVTGAHYERLKVLLNNGIGLYACHIPLDAHPEVGNNVQLAGIAGLQNLQRWGEHQGDIISYIGDLPQAMPLDRLVARIEAQIGKGCRTQSSGQPARRVAVLTGFGVDFAAAARAAGADTLITGETSHEWYHKNAELGINIIYGGHYATETLGVLALARKLVEKFQLDPTFIDLPTGM